MLGTLYIVATPIGNLEDITLRAIKTLTEVDIVLAEDTRVTRKLLERISENSLQKSENGIGDQKSEISGNLHQPPFTSHRSPTKASLLSYHQHSSEEKRLEILNFLMNGKNIALVTDAGTPGVSDPGNELVEYLLSFQPELQVVPIPGASSVTAALSVCGFNVSKFTFIGFLPKKKGRKTLDEAMVMNIPVVFFESPYRIIKTLISLQNLKHEPSKVFIAQELTKMHERTFRGNIEDAISWMQGEEKKLGRIKGEIVVILEP